MILRNRSNGAIGAWLESRCACGSAWKQCDRCSQMVRRKAGGTWWQEVGHTFKLADQRRVVVIGPLTSTIGIPAATTEVILQCALGVTLPAN